MTSHMTAHAHSIHHRRAHQGLHPTVYRSMIVLTIWFVLSIWMFFNSGAYVGLALAMITLFFLVIVAIPVLLWTTWLHNAAPNETRSSEESFHDWALEDFATWTGRLDGREAAMQILLPIAAVSIGMFIFGLVFYFDVPHAGY